MATVEIDTNDNNELDKQLNEKTLDEHFMGQVQEIVHLVLDHPNKCVVPLCTKWLKIFQKATEEEKTARNSLFTLMRQQLLNEDGLKEPFTDFQNCKHDLEFVFNKYIDIIDEISVKSGIKSANENANEEACSNDYYQPRNTNYPVVAYYPTMPTNHAGLLPIMEQNAIMQAENFTLRNNVKELRLKLTVTSIDKLRVESDYKKLRQNNRAAKQKLMCTKQQFRHTIESYLKSLDIPDTGDAVQTMPNLFVNLFSEIALNEPNFEQDIKQLDMDLLQQLRKCVRTEMIRRTNRVRKDICDTHIELKSKLCESYELKLFIHEATQRKILRYSEMRLLCVLCKIFVESCKGSKEKIERVIQHMEQQYVEAATNLEE